MKTKKSSSRHFVTLLVWFLLSAVFAHAQSAIANTEQGTASDPPPEKDDAASTQLIANYLTVTGGRERHMMLRNVVAEGTIKESPLQRNFKLVETFDGKRYLTYFWTHLGRKHRVVYVHDGLLSWTQVLEPKKQEAEPYGGMDGIHFANQRWLVQPFSLPLRANYVFKYQGVSKVSSRPAYIVKGYGKNDNHSWFYFDKEKSLLTRWGGEGQIAGSTQNMDYRATEFKTFGGLLMPSKIELLAQDAVFGSVRFETIKVNQDLNEISFYMPQSMSPTLRQRPVKSN